MFVSSCCSHLMSPMTPLMMGICTKFSDLWDAKIEIYIYIYIRQRKIITHKTWFGNLPTVTELQWFHYSQEKIQSTAVQFSLSKQHKILEGVWYMHLKTCVLLFENICEKMYENTYNVISKLKNVFELSKTTVLYPAYRIHNGLQNGPSLRKFSVLWTKPQKISY